MPEPFFLLTQRIYLFSASKEDIAAARRSREALAERLKVIVPQTWPPDGIDDAVLAFFEVKVADPSQANWWLWYVIKRDDTGGPNELIGTCGFKGKPDRAGAVEIGYSIVSEQQRHGYASEAVSAMVHWLWSQTSARMVVAEVATHNDASMKVLLKNGFAQIGPWPETGMVRFALMRPE